MSVGFYLPFLLFWANAFGIVGPSSSHTVGPMRAAKIFINDLVNLGLLDKVSWSRVYLPF